MAQEDVHLDDAGLALGLSLGGGGGASDAARQGTCSRLSREPRALEPSLTLSMPDEATATGSAAAKADPDRPKAAASHHFFNPFTHSAAC